MPCITMTFQFCSILSNKFIAIQAVASSVVIHFDPVFIVAYSEAMVHNKHVRISSRLLL